MFAFARRTCVFAAGALPAFPRLEEIRKGYGRDLPRESID
jgi:hypothetical protein